MVVFLLPCFFLVGKGGKTGPKFSELPEFLETNEPKRKECNLQILQILKTHRSSMEMHTRLTRHTPPKTHMASWKITRFYIVEDASSNDWFSIVML